MAKRSMKTESKGHRGKSSRKRAGLRLPIYLDAQLQEQLERIAQRKGKDIGEIVNQLVQRDLELIEEFS